MQNQLDLLLLSIPVEADGESLLLEGDGHVGDNLLEASCLGCKKQQQGHICPEDQLHWTEIPANLRQGGSLDAANNEHAKDQGKLGENCTVADPKSHVVEEEVGVSLNNILCNINAPLKDDLSGTSKNV